MGMVMSFMGKGLPTTQMLSLVMGTLHKQFMEKDVSDFEKFHMAILDMFNTVNEALPGKHYDVPLPEEVKACFEEWEKAELVAPPAGMAVEEWEKAKESKKMKIFTRFMEEKVNLSKLDNTTLVTGLVAPPAAMAAKRAGESVPQLKLIKAIPDVIFVPSATVLALISVKLSRKMILGQVDTKQNA